MRRYVLDAGMFLRRQLSKQVLIVRTSYLRISRADLGVSPRYGADARGILAEDLHLETFPRRQVTHFLVLQPLHCRPTRIIRRQRLQHLAKPSLAHGRRQQLLEFKFNAVRYRHHAPTIAIFQGAPFLATQNPFLRLVTHVPQLIAQDVRACTMSILRHTLEHHDGRVRFAENNQRAYDQVPNQRVFFRMRKAPLAFPCAAVATTRNTHFKHINPRYRSQPSLVKCQFLHRRRIRHRIHRPCIVVRPRLLKQFLTKFVRECHLGCYSGVLKARMNSV
ncbi:hypothetical protein RHDC4_02280 [Rhodocyclaceae bacterium]|nr:hypothetical protein RHDC4_02280 [Rhodocyclaceae bacterium]